MTIIETAFDKNALEYDNWFEKHAPIYQSEILALKEAIPAHKKGVEIGSGTGRFSLPFNIRIGVEPSPNMSILAEQKGMTIINSVAENLPFHNHSFDFALMVTTVCFLSDIPKAFSEVHRILKPQGEIILAFIDKNSELGKKYEKEKSENKFYKSAHFHSTQEITELLQQANFHKFSYWQTLTKNYSDEIEQPAQGFGTGSFVVIKAIKN
ncbi:MAG: methyltransferase type 11 [Bacteroidetes bacterium RIFCSPLOWO2_12_FULL_35_15]|nr:MAG: methyltransferase type 11 [Bacteroidetes bacterium RIFCSPLOWO2_12_FULL_35_15]